ncbi:Hypothetical predicted protein [Argonauta hians]
MFRSRAANKHTVLLHENERLQVKLCLRRKAFYSISSISYSNDGLSDVVTVLWNGATVGKFSSKTEYGNGALWNRFYSTERIMEPVALESGMYNLELFVLSADKFGIEIDTVNIETDDTTVGELILTCHLRCLENIPYTDEYSSTHPMTLVQRSFPTLCAEQDNIDVALFLQNISKYRIKASYPKYGTSFNRRNSMFEHCEALSPSLLWRLSSVNRSDSYVQTNLRSFTFEVKKHKIFHFKIEFYLKGKSEGLIDSDIGSNLVIKFKTVHKHFNVGCSHVMKNQHLSPVVNYSITPYDPHRTWTVPDYTWSEHKKNMIECSITSKFDQIISISYIELSRRKERGETHKYIYKDNDIIIKGINVDFWWRRPETMAIYHRNMSFLNIDYIVIYIRVPKTSSFQQIFVLYQDGNSRILPLPPKGIDWIPFGSSVIIGQSELKDFRPVSEISTIQIKKISRYGIIMYLEYVDGGTASIDVYSKPEQTEVTVTPIAYKRSLSKFPFARFRSMWVHDGLCDVDHLYTGYNRIFGILEGWKTLKTDKVSFFRKCQSSHLTLSPDIMIETI